MTRAFSLPRHAAHDTRLKFKRPFGFGRGIALGTGAIVSIYLLVREAFARDDLAIGSAALFSKASAPTANVSHSNFTPVASRMRTVAFITSGPIPSPGIRVTL